MRELVAYLAIAAGVLGGAALDSGDRARAPVACMLPALASSGPDGQDIGADVDAAYACAERHPGARLEFVRPGE